MGQFAIGQPVPRDEDPRLLKGLGQYLDDISLPNQAHAAVVRSPHAHARIVSVDASAALAAPGVLAVLTGADYAADGLGSLPCEMPRRKRDGSPMFHPPHPALVKDRARLVGDYVAFVVAETVAQAKDAAELVRVEYTALAPLTETAKARDAGAPKLWDGCADNEGWYMEVGSREATEAAFSKADRVVRRHFDISRVTGCMMEPRGCLGRYDPREDRYTLYTGLQNPHQLRNQLAADIFHLPETRFRIVAKDIGGSFGTRGGTYHELALVLWASKKVGRPVKWVCERSEGFASDDHARDNVSDVELAVTDAGKLLGMKVRTTANMGAYLSIRGTMPPIQNLGTLAGTYTTEAIHVAVSGVFTNTNSTSPYRGAGRPEAAYVVESMIEAAALELGLDPLEIRRRNTIPAAAMPYKTGLVFTYDCGDFAKSLDMAAAMIDYAGFAARRAESKARGRLRGMGVSNTVEQASGPNVESAEIRFDASGGLTLLMGTISQGQGHDITYKQILCERLGIDSEHIRVFEGDTDRVTFGRGTFGSRSGVVGGTAICLAADKIVAKAKRIAGHLLEAAETDIEFKTGKFAVAGTDRSVSLIDIAKTAFVPTRLPPEIEPGLDETAQYLPRVPTFPNGCHMCEVEVDPETGKVEVVDYVVVDDVGTVLNPLLLKGQIHGGVAQGLGQALMEEIRFDPGSGQLLTGSFMDYALPRADDLPSIEVESNAVPTKSNPLGAKGAGEAGTVGALPTVMNAVLNALAPLGVREIPMPASPERIWRVLQEAKRHG